MSSTMPTIAVAGALANKPLNGGEAWVRMSWVEAFRRLGADVLFVEQLADGTCVDEHGRPAPFGGSLNERWFDRVIERFGLCDGAALVHAGGCAVHGLDRAQLLERLSGADLLVNISGHLTLPELTRLPARRAYVDIDPGFTQIWHAGGTGGFQLGEHDAYFTIGENIGSSDCLIPTAGIRWRPIRQPVVLDQWPVAKPEGERFTTVASWRAPFGRVEWKGKTYGLKLDEFRRFIELPDRVGRRFELALDIHPAERPDLERLHHHGWRLVDPLEVAAEPDSFRDYVRGSKAEFSVAQGIYAETESGWVSDRSLRYLASGRPVLVQDTGAGRRLPVGDGLVVFSTLAEAAEGVERIEGNYGAHALAARKLAEEHFDSRIVAGGLLEEVLD